MKPSEAVPSLIDKPPNAITLWVLYDHPLDYPGFVLRPQFSVKKFEGMELFGKISVDVGAAVVILSPLTWHAATADELIAILPPNCFPIGPGPGDEPHIMQVWMET